MTAARFSTLLQQYINRSNSSEEESELMLYIADPSQKEEVMKVLSDLVLSAPQNRDLNTFSANRILKKILAENKKPRTLTVWFRYAAAIIIMLGVGSYLWFNNTAPNPINQKNPLNPSSGILPGGSHATLTLADGSTIILDSTQGNIVQQGNLKIINLAGKLDYEGVGTGAEIHTLTTPKGGQYQLLLPDGSKVWLNAASSITYPTAFAGNDRTVTISGEAYFEVANDKSKIFHVKTPKEEITVLGTHFNVNAYADEMSTKTSLLEGAIKIGNFILKPGQAYTNGKIITTNIEQDVAWKNGFFNFEGVDLPGVMHQLERWYGIEVKYEGKTLPRKFHGKMERALNLSEILEILTQMEINYRMEGKTLIIMN